MDLIRMFVVSLLLAVSPTLSAQNSLDELDWQLGPGEGQIGSDATISIPEGFMFLGAEDTATLMEWLQNIPTDTEYVLAPVDFTWFAVFEFNPVGYVKDDEELDSADLLASVTRGTEASNVEREKRGWSTMSILGWRFEPRYDTDLNVLEWAFRAQDDASQEEIINYNTRLLGRTGVMEVVVVADPSMLDQAVSDFKGAIGGFDFTPGNRYADYKSGDRVAQFGLAALVAGGAAAVAQKKGFWAMLAGLFAAMWKVIAAVAIGAIAWIASLFKKKPISDV